MTLHSPCRLLPSDRQRQVSLLPPCCSLPLGHISQQAHVRRGHTNCLSHPQTHWCTNADTQPRGHALGWIYRRVWGFFPSKLPLCRRNTAPNKLFNPIISPSPALFPDIFHCSQSEVCFGTCHREWQAVWMCFLPTFPWNSLVNKPYMRCFFFFLFFFSSLTWRENKCWHQHMRHGRLQLLQAGEHSRCTDWACGRRLKTKTFDILRDSCVFVFWGAVGVSREREALPRPSDVNQGKGLDTDALPPLPLLPPSLLPSSFGLNCLSHVLSLSVGRELSFYTCTFLSNIRGALSSRQSVCTTHTWTNTDTHGH